MNPIVRVPGKFNIKRGADGQNRGNDHDKPCGTVASIGKFKIESAIIAFPCNSQKPAKQFAATAPRAFSGNASGLVLDKKMNVQFDANVNSALDWRFRPVQHQIRLKIGEEALAFYRAKNLSDKSVTGTAVFNVSPPLAGKYFNKVDCFCFTEQTLKPGQQVDMPVTFYIDPEIVNDKDLKNLKTITLSYTFYEKEKDKTAAVKTLTRASDTATN